MVSLVYRCLEPYLTSGISLCYVAGIRLVLILVHYDIHTSYGYQKRKPKKQSLYILKKKQMPVPTLIPVLRKQIPVSTLILLIPMHMVFGWNQFG
ncbi:hypothetical protein Hanom_Chr14g01327061 [Helianthus anomalus]